MANVNKVIILGRIGQDPELKVIPNGTSVVKFSVATTETWKDKEGQKQELTEWTNVEFWGKPAEIIAQYFFKGSRIYIEGSLKTDKYDKEGQTHYSTKVKGREFDFVDEKKDSGQQQPQGAPQDGTPRKPAPEGFEYNAQGNLVEIDLPF